MKSMPKITRTLQASKPRHAAWFDIDGTLTPIRSSWQLLHRELGTERVARNNAKLVRDHRMSFEAWARADARLWTGFSVRRIEQVLETIPLRRGALDLVKGLQKLKFFTIAISSAPSILACRIQQELLLDAQRSNTLIASCGVLTGRVRVVVGDHNKGQIASAASREAEVDDAHAVAFGDSQFDVDLFKRAGMAVALYPDAEMVRRGDFRTMQPASLTELLPIVKQWMRRI
jgi:phosphoserine phosphatase